MSKPGFSTYIKDRFTGFDGRAAFQADDVRRLPESRHAAVRHATRWRTRVLQLRRPGEVKDQDAVTRDIERLRRALGDAAAATAFMGAISPGQIAFNYPNQHYRRTRRTSTALADALRHEYRAITDAGFNLQIDSPDLAMAAHCRSVGSSDRRAGTRTCRCAIDALNRALEGIPPEQVRLHLCWGNYAGPHHCDIRWTTSRPTS